MDDLHALEDTFLRLAVERAESLAQRRVRRANRLYDRLHNLKDQMRQLPDGGRAILRRIAGHPRAEVQIIAAAALLGVDEEFAIACLTRIREEEPGSAAFTAEMTIREWQSGALRAHWA